MTIRDFCCAVPDHLGQSGSNCDSITVGVEATYYTCYKNLSTVVYQDNTPKTDPKAYIDSFTLNGSTADHLLKEISFMKLDDDSGVVGTQTVALEDGNKKNNLSVVFKAIVETIDQQSTLDSLINEEICLVFKMKNGKYKAWGFAGGLKGQQYSGNTNQSWTEITFSGAANERVKFIDDVFAALAMVPASIDPTNGLIDA